MCDETEPALGIVILVKKTGSKQGRNTTEVLAGCADVCGYAEPGVATGSEVELDRQKI